MAFKMNKPIIIGTKKHSALLAKASGTVDPTLGTAASIYGQSMNPDVIDYTIKQAKIEWDKKKKKEEDPPPPEEQQEEEISLEKEKIKEDDIDYDALFAPEEDDPDLTSVERKKKDAKRDSDVAIEKLELQRLKQLSVDELSDKPIEAKKREREGLGTTTGTKATAFGKDIKSLEGVSAENLIKLKSVSPEDIELGRVQDIRIDGKGVWVERPWYTKQRIKTKKQSTKTLMAEYGTTDPVEIEKIYQANQKALRTKIRKEFEAKYDTKKKEVTKKKEEKKVVKKKTDKSTSKPTSKTDSDKKRQDFIYKLKGPAGQKKMRDAGYKPPKK